MAGVSIAYVTHRPQPRFDWFADSLAAQLDGDADPEVIFVDGLHSAERTAELEAAVRSRFTFRHVPPKPTPWNGPHRLTGRDYFAAASARNTGIVHASAPYVAFADDCAVLMPGWWDEVRAAARHGYVIAGAYEKRTEVVVQDGVPLTSRFDPAVRDASDGRWELGDDEALVQIVGGQLYGCSFGAPRELLVRVNGLDELCDPIGGEDYHLGIRLELAGARIFYSRRMFTLESEAAGHDPGLVRLGRSLEPEVYMRRLAELGIGHRSTDGEWDNSHMVLDFTYGRGSSRSFGNYYDLEGLTAARLEETTGQFPREYWFDGTPLAAL